MTDLLFFVNLLIHMVNERISHPPLISLLKEADEPLSGEKLSRILGVSRVAVWKQIGRLELEGYTIESSRKGYRLIEEPSDPLKPYLFEGKETFYCLEETPSTMDHGEKLLSRLGRDEEFLVTAEKQTSGRGRHQREWISPRGGLFYTHSFPAALPAHLSYQITMAALSAWTEILRDELGLAARIKWPNDILVDHKKIVGLLSTTRSEGERINRINLGIGINVNNAPPLPDSTASLSQLTGRGLSRSELMKSYLEKMRRYRANGPQERAARFRSLWAPLKEVKIMKYDGEIIGGPVESIDIQGALHFTSGRTLFPGECEKILTGH